MNISRLGAVPCASVKMPHAPPGYDAQPLKFAVVFWSSQYGKMAYVLSPVVVVGRHELVNAVLPLTNPAVPLDDKFTLVKVWS